MYYQTSPYIIGTTFTQPQIDPLSPRHVLGVVVLGENFMKHSLWPIHIYCTFGKLNMFSYFFLCVKSLFQEQQSSARIRPQHLGFSGRPARDLQFRQ